MNERSEYVNLIVDRYCDAVYPDGDTAVSYEAENDYLWLVNAPEQYEVEPQMLEYTKAHPSASMKDLIDYFDDIAPLGLAPGDDGEDLLDDE